MHGARAKKVRRVAGFTPVAANEIAEPLTSLPVAAITLPVDANVAGVSSSPAPSLAASTVAAKLGQRWSPPTKPEQAKVGSQTEASGSTSRAWGGSSSLTSSAAWSSSNSWGAAKSPSVSVDKPLAEVSPDLFPVRAKYKDRGEYASTLMVTAFHANKKGTPLPRMEPSTGLSTQERQWPPDYVRHVAYRQLSQQAFEHDVNRYPPPAGKHEDVSEWSKRKQKEQEQSGYCWKHVWPEHKFTDEFAAFFMSEWTNPLVRFFTEDNFPHPWFKHCVIEEPFKGAEALHKAALQSFEGYSSYGPSRFDCSEFANFYKAGKQRPLSDAYILCRALFQAGVEGRPVDFETVMEGAATFFGYDVPNLLPPQSAAVRVLPNDESSELPVAGKKAAGLASHSCGLGAPQSNLGAAKIPSVRGVCGLPVAPPSPSVALALFPLREIVASPLAFVKSLMIRDCIEGKRIGRSPPRMVAFRTTSLGDQLTPPDVVRRVSYRQLSLDAFAHDVKRSPPPSGHAEDAGEWSKRMQKVQSEDGYPWSHVWPELEFEDDYVASFMKEWKNPLARYCEEGNFPAPWGRTGLWKEPFKGGTALRKAAQEQHIGFRACEGYSDATAEYGLYLKKSVNREFSDAYLLCRTLFQEGVEGRPVDLETVLESVRQHFSSTSSVSVGVASLPSAEVNDSEATSHAAKPVSLVSGPVAGATISRVVPSQHSHVVAEESGGVEVHSDGFKTLRSAPQNLPGMDTYYERTLKHHAYLRGSTKKTHPAAPMNKFMENTPRVTGSKAKVRPDRDRVPSHGQVSALVRKMIPAPYDEKFQKQFDWLVKCQHENCPADSDYHNDFIGRTRIVHLEQSFQHAWQKYRQVDDDHPEYTNDNEGFFQSSVKLIDLEDNSPFKGKLTVPSPEKNITPCELRFYLMSVVCNRRLGPLKKLSDPVMDAAQVRMVSASSKLDLADDRDAAFTAVIVVNPDLGFFYSSRDMYLPGADGNPANKERGHLPIPISALRLRRSDGLPAEGGYVKKFLSCYCFSGFIPSPEKENDVLMTRVLQAIQVSDKVGPPLPPNIFEGWDTNGKTLEDLRTKYREALQASGSRKLGGRHYVSGSHYVNLKDDPRFSACKIWDPKEDGNVDVHVGVHETYTKLKKQTPPSELEKDDDDDDENVDDDEDDNHFGMDRESFKNYDATRMQEHTVVQVRDTYYPCNEAALRVINTNAFEAARKEIVANGPTGSCRSEAGDYGLMVPLGSSIVDPLSEVPWEYAATKRATNLQQTAAAATGIAHQFFPGQMAALQRTEKEVGIPEAKVFEQDAVVHESLFHDVEHVSPAQRCTSSIICSCNLQNAGHFDPMDAMVGIGIWTCTHGVDGVRNWYFVLPNLIGFNEDGTVFQGLAIRLHHGIAIAWDGRVLRHCTSRTEGVRDPAGADVGVTGHVFSTYLGTKALLVERFRQANYEKARDLEQKRKAAAEVEKRNRPCNGGKRKRNRNRGGSRKK